MSKKNISKANSFIDAFSVIPNICRPLECRLSLNIRKTRTNRITRNIASDDDCDDLESDEEWNRGSSGFSANIVAKVTKYGTIAKKSIAFIISYFTHFYINIHLLFRQILSPKSDFLGKKII